jgi:hypothetical protein
VKKLATVTTSLLLLLGLTGCVIETDPDSTDTKAAGTSAKPADQSADADLPAYDCTADPNCKLTSIGDNSESWDFGEIAKTVADPASVDAALASLGADQEIRDRVAAILANPDGTTDMMVVPISENASGKTVTVMSSAAGAYVPAYATVSINIIKF